MITVAEEGADKVPGEGAFDVDLGDPVRELLACLRLPAGSRLRGREGVVGHGVGGDEVTCCPNENEGWSKDANQSMSDRDETNERAEGGWGGVWRRGEGERQEKGARGKKETAVREALCSLRAGDALHVFPSSLLGPAGMCRHVVVVRVSVLFLSSLSFLFATRVSIVLPPSSSTVSILTYTDSDLTSL